MKNLLLCAAVLAVASLSGCGGGGAGTGSQNLGPLNFRIVDIDGHVTTFTANRSGSNATDAKWANAQLESFRAGHPTGTYWGNVISMDHTGSDRPYPGDANVLINGNITPTATPFEEVTKNLMDASLPQSQSGDCNVVLHGR